ncbi:hypothetical protein AB3S75_006696 [Citrus x aurantiifolia]
MLKLPHLILILTEIALLNPVFFRQLPPDNPRRPSPSEIFSFSEFVKSQWSAASAKYSKGSCSLKERLLSRNTSGTKQRCWV